MKENSNYKPVNGRLVEHFGFRVNSDSNVDNVEAVCCIHCHKSLAYHGSNTAFSAKPCHVF